ncbi:hypothetical protein QQZ08_011366 [Neonectria magnoliae]|uniref:Uncharacterized protein n=1 Tax=Neonectria magnoliae TaxID=2732573 RepID=A0ABR1HC45_9HYPO
MRAARLGYTIDMYNQSYPKFTTSSYALLPFRLHDNLSASRTERNWTAETTKLWVDVDCSPAKVSEGKYMNTTLPRVASDIEGNERTTYIHFESMSYTAQLDRGCSVELELDLSLRYWYPILGTASPVDRPKRDQKPYAIDRNGLWNCPTSFDNSSLVVVYWATPLDMSLNASKEMNITALQCDLSYHKQRVRATVESQNLQPIDMAIQKLSKPKPLRHGEFNATSYLKSVPGDGRVESTAENMDYKEGYTGGVVKYCDSFCTYITEARGYEKKLFSDADRLGRAAQLFYQQLFSLTVSTRLVKEKRPDQGSATSAVYMTNIMLSRLFAVLSEVLLLLAAAALGYLSFSLASSTCHLSQSPSSIADLIDIAHNSPEVVELLEPMDSASEKALAHSIGGVNLKLDLDHKLAAKQTRAEQPHGPRGLKTADPQHYKPIKPWILRRVTGSVLMVVLLAGIVVLAYFKAVERRENGLQRPSQPFEVLQLLENYIPTAFATGIEPIWILLTRTMCVFQPFNDLWKGNSSPRRSIAATHTSVPPQLALFKAIHSRHILLSLLCFAVLLANALAIALSALFIERPVTVQQPEELDFQDQAKFISSKVGSLRYTDTWDDPVRSIIWANMTAGSRLPPWVSTKFFFQPLAMTGTDQSQTMNEYTVRTRGFGANVNCTAIPPLPYSDYPLSDNIKMIFSCDEPVAYLRAEYLRRAHDTEDALAVFEELPLAMTDVNIVLEDVQSGHCPPLLGLGWGRVHTIGENANVSISQTICLPFVQTAIFDVTVDRDGFVARYHRTSDLQTLPNNPARENRANLLLLAVNSKLATAGWAAQSTPTVADCLSDYIFKDMNSRDFLDPKRPVPDPSELIPSIERAYSQIFAALLAIETDYLEATEATFSVDTRIFMDNVAFIIIMAVLALDFLIALVFYLPETLYILLRPPTSALSIMAYIAPSRAVRDGRPPGGWKEQTFSFGRYRGYDGKGHVGIEKDPHVRAKDTSLGSYKPLLQRDVDAGTV